MKENSSFQREKKYGLRLLMIISNAFNRSNNRDCSLHAHLSVTPQYKYHYIELEQKDSPKKTHNVFSLVQYIVPEIKIEISKKKISLISARTRWCERKKLPPHISLNIAITNRLSRKKEKRWWKKQLCKNRVKKATDREMPPLLLVAE